MGAGRTAPSVTGEAHPGTLLSALLAWLDARSRGDRFLLRLEDNDHTRDRPGLADALQADLAWFGLDWDDVVLQSRHRAEHEAALDRLEAAGLLYPCRCSRADRSAGGRRAPDGGFAYDNTCRGRPLPPGGWRAAREQEPVRATLPDRAVALVDEGGLDLSQHPAREMGDPVLVRRDGALAYHLVVVVDDAAAGVTRVVRGRDIAPSTATHVLLQEMLGLAQPTYRHHLLLLEPRGAKLAKLHGSVGAATLRARYGPGELCGILAWAAGLVAAPAPVTPRALVDGFAWERVRGVDAIARWTGSDLEVDLSASR
ncbi:MAG TPA: glutamate--tRNA ligase family protein [Kofleriaceae bacterium]|nr:glutamate--tRNA ligase family protein [Kofleriaceae bacterium]